LWFWPFFNAVFKKFYLNVWCFVICNACGTWCFRFLHIILWVQYWVLVFCHFRAALGPPLCSTWHHIWRIRVFELIGTYVCFLTFFCKLLYLSFQSLCNQFFLIVQKAVLLYWHQGVYPIKESILKNVTWIAVHNKMGIFISSLEAFVLIVSYQVFQIETWQVV